MINWDLKKKDIKIIDVTKYLKKVIEKRNIDFKKFFWSIAIIKKNGNKSNTKKFNKWLISIDFSIIFKDAIWC